MHGRKLAVASGAGLQGHKRQVWDEGEGDNEVKDGVMDLNDLVGCTLPMAAVHSPIQEKLPHLPLHHVPLVLPFPFSVSFQPTHRAGLACPHCVLACPQSIQWHWRAWEAILHFCANVLTPLDAGVELDPALKSQLCWLSSHAISPQELAPLSQLPSDECCLICLCTSGKAVRCNGLCCS